MPISSPKNNPNKNNQLAIAKTDAKSTTHAFAKIWVVECQDCKTQYGSNGCDFHMRRSPNPDCQEGATSEPIPPREKWQLI